MTPSISLRDLTIGYGGETVVPKLDLDIEAGEFIVLLGPSGCGKSTLLNAIAGLVDIADGEIWIGGRNVTWAEPKDRGIGMVFQSYALYPRMTVRKNLSFGLAIAGVDRDEIARQVGEVADILQLTTLLDRMPAALSGGQRQRVAIGRAMVRHVDVFLFDEPLSNLDARLRADLRVEIKRLHQRLGNTMIYVTHDQVEALTLADRVAVMKKGVIQQLSSPADLYGCPVNRYVAEFVGSPAMNFLDGQVAAGTSPVFRLASGRTLDLGAYSFTRPPGEGRAAVLGIRPEHIVIGEPPTERTAFDGVVTVVEPMGSDSIVWADHAGVTLRIRGDGEQSFRPGDAIRFHFDPVRASLFDAVDGLRI